MDGNLQPASDHDILHGLAVAVGDDVVVLGAPQLLLNGLVQQLVEVEVDDRIHEAVLQHVRDQLERQVGPVPLRVHGRKVVGDGSGRVDGGEDRQVGFEVLAGSRVVIGDLQPPFLVIDPLADGTRAWPQQPVDIVHGLARGGERHGTKCAQAGPGTQHQNVSARPRRSVGDRLVGKGLTDAVVPAAAEEFLALQRSVEVVQRKLARQPVQGRFGIGCETDGSRRHDPPVGVAEGSRKRALYARSPRGRQSFGLARSSCFV